MEAMTPAQLLILAEELEKRFSENRSLFQLVDPPRHTLKVALSPVLELIVDAYNRGKQYRSAGTIDVILSELLERSVNPETRSEHEP